MRTALDDVPGEVAEEELVNRPLRIARPGPAKGFRSATAICIFAAAIAVVITLAFLQRLRDQDRIEALEEAQKAADYQRTREKIEESFKQKAEREANQQRRDAELDAKVKAEFEDLQHRTVEAEARRSNPELFKCSACKGRGLVRDTTGNRVCPICKGKGE